MPSFLKRAFASMRRLLIFFENISACNIYIPSTSLKVMGSFNWASPIPFTDCLGSARTFTSASLAYMQGAETGESAADRSIAISLATSLQVPPCVLSHSFLGGLGLRVALPVAMPSLIDVFHQTPTVSEKFLLHNKQISSNRHQAYNHLQRIPD